MEHTDAILSNAAERYLLGEMTEDEQNGFEQHYFDCRVCAADVTDGTRMMMAGRVVAAEEAPTSNVVPMPSTRFRWVQTAAAASLIFGLLGSGAGYQVARWQDQRPPELVRPAEVGRVVRIVTGVSRAGGSDTVPIAREGDRLVFDVQPHDDAVEYGAVVSCGGKIQSTQRISRKRAAEDIELQLGELPAGRCELVIEGVRKDGNRFEITSSPFEGAVGER